MSAPRTQRKKLTKLPKEQRDLWRRIQNPVPVEKPVSNALTIVDREILINDDVAFLRGEEERIARDLDIKIGSARETFPIPPFPYDLYEIQDKVPVHSSERVYHDWLNRAKDDGTWTWEADVQVRNRLTQAKVDQALQEYDFELLGVQRGLDPQSLERYEETQRAIETEAAGDVLKIAGTALAKRVRSVNHRNIAMARKALRADPELVETPSARKVRKTKEARAWNLVLLKLKYEKAAIEKEQSGMAANDIDAGVVLKRKADLDEMVEHLFHDWEPEEMEEEPDGVGEKRARVEPDAPLLLLPPLPEETEAQGDEEFDPLLAYEEHELQEMGYPMDMAVVEQARSTARALREEADSIASESVRSEESDEEDDDDRAFIDNREEIVVIPPEGPNVENIVNHKQRGMAFAGTLNNYDVNVIDAMHVWLTDNTKATARVSLIAPAAGDAAASVVFASDIRRMYARPVMTLMMPDNDPSKQYWVVHDFNTESYNYAHYFSCL